MCLFVLSLYDEQVSIPPFVQYTSYREVLYLIDAAGMSPLGANPAIQNRITLSASRKGGIAHSLREAKWQIQLKRHDIASKIEERLAVLLLSNDERQLCCAVKNFTGHLSPWTPVDFYVFSVNNHLERKFAQTCDRTLGAGLVFLKLQEHWETPEAAEDPSLWTAPHFSEDYRRMGHWRLAFQMEFAAKLGYKYVLQMDDDSAFPHPVTIDLVKHMAAQNISMAARNIISGDDADVTRGLAELAKFFLVSEGMEPTTLFTECRPADIRGLFTKGIGGPQSEGYSTRYLIGNFMIISLDFWYQEHIQRFVKLVLRTGAHFRYRWNEQQVQALVWQMFLPPDNFHLFDFPYNHPVKPWVTCD